MKCIIVAFLSLISILLPAQERNIHVVVALCDNINQGIVKVPAKIGNGQDPANNLYWGCNFGVKTFFRRHADWKLVRKIEKPAPDILERVVFRHTGSPVHLVADAYDGAAIRAAINDFLHYAAGRRGSRIDAGGVAVKLGGAADLVCYVGHNGLMDFVIDVLPSHSGEGSREVMILACMSREYFREAMKKAGAHPLLWTSGLMAPEAYTLAAAIAAWIRREPGGTILERAAQAYNQYQACGIQSARALFRTGF